jgi:hypothetical protein
MPNKKSFVRCAGCDGYTAVNPDDYQMGKRGKVACLYCGRVIYVILGLLGVELYDSAIAKN